MQRLHGLCHSLETVDGTNCHIGKGVCRSPMLKTYADSLRSNSGLPPVVFFVEYVDMWSMGDVFGRCLPRRRSPNIVNVVQDEFEVWGYRLPDAGALKRQATRLLSSRSVRETSRQEQRWFLSNIVHALDAWDKITREGALIIIREVLGALVEDSDVQQAINHVPQWIAPNLNVLELKGTIRWEGNLAAARRRSNRSLPPDPRLP